MQQMFKLNDLNICIKKCQPHFEADTSNVFPGRWARLPVFYIICSSNKTRLRCSVSKCFPIFVLYRTNLLFKKQQIFSMCPEPRPQCYCRSTVILHSVSEINKAVIEKNAICISCYVASEPALFGNNQASTCQVHGVNLQQLNK